MARSGIDRERIELVGREPWECYIETCNRVDIALDPFPYGGGITTCDALWMGAPVVTLRGRTAVGRGGYSILSNIGLPELIAETPAQYIDIAISLANNPSKLIDLRLGLRERMEHSPLRDAKSFAQAVEQAFRQMWRNWCAHR
jgi:predicted O-linked N-acetylglucosamine transferase (SPINDLY family)